MDREIQMTVNGKTLSVKTNPERRLLEVLREDLELTGTNFGCKEGLCGACTVLVGGKPYRSCLLQVGRAENKQITTIEGLAKGDKLHPVQVAFLEEEAFQCGYCTPGMILNTVALLQEKAKPTDDEIREWMDGNICRCNGYTKIIRAIRLAATNISEGKTND